MLIRNGLEKDALHRYRITPTGLPILHLFFADDFVLFGNASVEEAQGVMEVLQAYAKGSGQVVNLSKSSVFFGLKTKLRTRKKIVETLGI